MFARFMPKEGRFFEFFIAHANLAKECSQKVSFLLSHLDQKESIAKEVESFEKQADKITYETIDLLHTTFITPLDRDQIHKLISTMDDILDLMEDVAQTIYLYDIQSVTPDAVQLAEITIKCCERIYTSLTLLEDLRNADAIMQLCNEVDILETDADKIMRNAMAELFRNEMDTRQLIKIKAIYELLEEVTDRCEDVANIIEGIVLENA